MAQTAEKWAVPFLWMADCYKKSTRSPDSQEVARKANDRLHQKKD